MNSTCSRTSAVASDPSSSKIESILVRSRPSSTVAGRDRDDITLLAKQFEVANVDVGEYGVGRQG